MNKILCQASLLFLLITGTVIINSVFITNAQAATADSSFQGQVDGYINQNNITSLTQLLNSASTSQFASLNSNTFSTNTMADALNSVASTQISNLVQNISSESFNNLVGTSIGGNKSTLLKGILISATNEQLQGSDSTAFSTNIMVDALKGATGAQISNIVQNISSTSFNNLVGSSINGSNSTLLNSVLTSATNTQLSGMDKQAFSTTTMADALNVTGTPLDKLIPNISSDSFNNLVGTSINGNKSGLLKGIFTSATNAQLQGVDATAFSTNTMVDALKGATGAQISNIVQNISSTSFNNLVGSSINGSNSTLLNSVLTSATNTQLSGMDKQAFSTTTMADALNTMTDPLKFNNVVKNISTVSFNNLVGTSINGNNSELLNRTLASGSNTQIQAVSGSAFSTQTMFTAVGQIYNNAPADFSQFMQRLSPTQTSSLLDSKGYTYTNGNFYNSAKQEVNPSTIFPAMNTLQANGTNDPASNPISTFNPKQLQSKTPMPIDGVQSISPQQQQQQSPTGIQLEKKL